MRHTAGVFRVQSACQEPELARRVLLVCFERPACGAIESRPTRWRNHEMARSRILGITFAAAAIASLVAAQPPSNYPPPGPPPYAQPPGYPSQPSPNPQYGDPNSQYAQSDPNGD